MDHQDIATFVGPRLIVFDQFEGYRPYVLGWWTVPTEPDQRFRTRIDDCWWLLDMDGEPVYDDEGRRRQVARFEIGPECQYRFTSR